MRVSWRAWRRSRPFWAGVLLVLSGAEILLIPLPVDSMGLLLHIGTGGVLGILIGALLIVCALLLWFSPEQRMFYSVVAVLLALAALVATNLGGFVAGTLLGVVGGSLGFAWTPADPACQTGAHGAGTHGRSWRRSVGRHSDSSAGLGLVLGDAPDRAPADRSTEGGADGAASGGPEDVRGSADDQAAACTEG